jgi:hypothetical protein
LLSFSQLVTETTARFTWVTSRVQAGKVGITAGWIDRRDGGLGDHAYLTDGVAADKTMTRPLR